MLDEDFVSQSKSLFVARAKLKGAIETTIENDTGFNDRELSPLHDFIENFLSGEDPPKPPASPEYIEIGIP